MPVNPCYKLKHKNIVHKVSKILSRNVLSDPFAAHTLDKYLVQHPNCKPAIFTGETSGYYGNDGSQASHKWATHSTTTLRLWLLDVEAVRIARVVFLVAFHRVILSKIIVIYTGFCPIICII